MSTIIITIAGIPKVERKRKGNISIKKKKKKEYGKMSDISGE